MHETALRTAIGTDEPSIGYWWKKWNATTCYEAFPAETSPTNGPSLNHIFLCGGIGHWMWKHLVGLIPTSPGFATVSLNPLVDDAVGPKSVSGQFLSPKGMISSTWNISDASLGEIKLSVSLPVGVQSATIVVPKPTKNGIPSTSVLIDLDGQNIWDGTKLVRKSAGILRAQDGQQGVTFETTNGVFEFVSKAFVSELPIPVAI